MLYAPMHTLHGLRFQHLAVGGLVEGEFPAPRTVRGMLDRGAREQLAAAGLELPSEARVAEEKLWRSVSSRAERSMSAWRPRIDDRGRPHAASYYFESLGVPAVEAPSGVEPERAASQRELAVALTSGWAGGERRRPRDMASWPVVRTAVAVEQLRRSFSGAGAYEGVLPPASLERLTAPEMQWSASRLESYLTCAYQFFGRYGLRLTELDQELEGADAATRGTVIHNILEESLAPLAGGPPLGPDNVTEAIERLRAIGPGIWDRAPSQYGFGRAALWRLDAESVLVALEALLEREAQRAPGLKLTETTGTEVVVSGELDAHGEPMRMFGVVDRIDRGDDVIQVVDYKSGRAIPRADLVQRKRVQLQLYAQLAARHQDAERVIARYAYLDPRHETWQLDTAIEQDAALVRDALDTAGAVRDSVRSGDLRVNPQVPDCPPYCNFRNICRVNEYSRWKAWS